MLQPRFRNKAAPKYGVRESQLLMKLQAGARQLQAVLNSKSITRELKSVKENE